MAETEYQRKLLELLNARRDWLEREKIPKLKEDLRAFYNAFNALYSLCLRRKVINEDFYKQESKVSELEIPDTAPFAENERIDKLTIRLANYDNQLDFLVNFYSFDIEYLPLDKIKLILGLVKYIDWVRFSADMRAAPNTKGMVETVNQLKSGADQISMSIISDSLSNLSRLTVSILDSLKEVTAYGREAYKYALREKVLSAMAPGEASQLGQIKKKFASLMPRKPFYPDLADEIIQENYSNKGPALRDAVLKRLELPAAKPLAGKPKVSFKGILIEGLLAIGGTASMLGEIMPKLDENSILLLNKRKGFIQKIRKLVQQMLNKEPESPEYEVTYTDKTKGVTVKETVVFANFKAEVDRKYKNLINFNLRNVPRMEALEDSHLLGLLERNIRDAQVLHRTISALDEYFKTAADKEDRDKIKGVKPELGTIKNAIVKANQKRYEYSAQKEEEEQFKRLGIGGAKS
ncbi:MAG: hypothetical protein LBD37_01660 [Treponema sp.]|jgi:hypothetical protein|nr:hypothetical protein [Treponema sp.]